MLKIAKFTLLLGLVFAAFSSTSKSQETNDSEFNHSNADQTVPQPIKNLIEGYNSADPVKMGASLSQDCQIWYVDADGKPSIGSKTRQALVAEMGRYFKNVKKATSEISDVSIIGRFVTARESVTWRQDLKTRKQYSLVVFEMSVNKKEIAKVWYYPAQK